MGLIARELEKNGIATVTLNMFLELAEKVLPPRTVNVNFPFGAPFGDPDNKVLQLKVMRAALDMLDICDVPGKIKELPYDWRENN